MFLLKEEHDGIGGLYFISVSVICSIITVIVTSLSYMSQIVTMADNYAYIVTINIASENYLCNNDSYNNAVNKTFTRNEKTYNPLNDYSNMLTKLKMVTKTPETVTISWNKEHKNVIVQFSEFKDNLGNNITPHRQEAIIEND